jgi:hypothetical protein
MNLIGSERKSRWAGAIPLRATSKLIARTRESSPPARWRAADGRQRLDAGLGAVIPVGKPQHGAGQHQVGRRARHGLRHGGLRGRPWARLVVERP